MVGILSIDFDYFIDASSAERDLYFPVGSDEIPKDRLKSMWKERYLKYPKLKEVGVIDEYYFLKNFLHLLNIHKKHFYKADTHKYIKKLIDIIPWKNQLRIVNIDFHHDYYHYYTGGDNYNCGNWLRRLIEERPNTKVRWIRRKDSQINSLEGEFPFEHTTDIKSIANETFDYVFICRSPEWSPPHLRDKFEELARAVIRPKTA
ncbi:MAG: hypothetical protein GX306_12530 [Clostridiales bacterium]|jgi:hypothetical protein|nr:hypothetical protein [Clostridiales bacterium]